MALFITRVELHDATIQDYVNLHTHMATEGYSTTIRGSDGRTYRLPPAEYHLDAACSRDQALERAKRAALRTRRSFSLLVSEAVGISWVGLATVQPTRGLAHVF